MAIDVEELKKICMLGAVRTNDYSPHELSHDLPLYCISRLEKLGYTPEIIGKTIYAKGTMPVLLCAHLDTVHTQPCTRIVQTGSKLISPQGIGGDDRCGVYIVLELIKEFHCSVLFSLYEETSDLEDAAASQFIRSDDKPKTLDCSYAIEFDEPEKNKAVYYETGNNSFEKLIEQDGCFKRFDSLGDTDLRFLCVAYNIAGVNLSCGYYENHSVNEYIDIKDMDDCLEHARAILKRSPNRRFTYCGDKVKVICTQKNSKIKSAYIIAKPIENSKAINCLAYLTWYFSCVQKCEEGVTLKLADGWQEITADAFNRLPMFYDYINLKKLILPKTLRIINSYAFYLFSIKLPVIIPEHVHILHNNIFNSETKTVICEGDIQYIHPNSVGENPNVEYKTVD